MGNRGWLARLLGYCWRYRRHVLLAFGGALLGMTVTALTPLIQRAIVDHAIIARDTPLAPLAVALIGAALVSYGTTFVRRYYGGRLSIDVQHQLRTEMFGALAGFDGAQQDELRTGQIVSRTISDITMVQGLLAMVPIMTGNLLLFVISLIAMLWLSPVLTLIALAVGPGLWLLAKLSARTLFPATWAAQQEAGVVAGVVDDAVTGVRVVKGFGQEEQELDKLSTAARRLYALRMRAVRLTAKYNPVMQAIPALGPGRGTRARRLAGCARAASASVPSSPSPPTSRSSSGRYGCFPTCSPSASRHGPAWSGCSR